jgi:hypothetical protein
MKYLISYPVLHAILVGGPETTDLLQTLEKMLQDGNRFYATAISLFEIIQGRHLSSPEDQREFLNQSGILCDEIFPVTKDDLALYSRSNSGFQSAGMEGLELSVAVNRGLDGFLSWESKLSNQNWMKVIDLKSGK